MQRSQIDFLNHGILPFVGRAAEMDEIMTFWRETAGSAGLRAMLLVGEGGIGKSRLIEEASRRIAAAGGVVIHTRLYPGAATSLAPLLARSLARSSNALQLLKMEPEESTASVASALLRICGLRPTLLVIEDMHLLQGDALNDFARLLDMLADEPISLLCAVRPVTIQARSILERHLIGEIELPGLPAHEIAAICQEVFGQKVSDEIIDILRDKTLGNTLALRSALRAGVKPGTTSLSPRGQGDSILVDQQSFIETLERNVRLLSEGMVAHLSEQEKAAAEKLASLGEVFAREAALAILENGSTILEALTFKGIIAGLVSAPSPLSGEPSGSSPLAFTHTLLHRHFIDRQNFDPDTIVCVLARELPLYSILPFPLLLDSNAPLRADPETLRRAVMRALGIATIVDRGSNWSYAITIWQAASMLAAKVAGMLPPEDWQEVQIRLGINKLALQRREPGSDLPQVLEELLELTKEIRNPRWVDYRLLALLYKRRQVARQNPAAGLEMLKEVTEIVEHYPEARSLRSYIGHLRDSARIALLMQDVDLMREMETRVEELIEDCTIPDGVRREAWILITSHFFSLFTTPEELQKRTRQLQQLETAAYDRVSDLLVWKLDFLYAVGSVDEALAAAEKGVLLYRERGLLAESLSCRVLGIFARALLGEDTERLTEELRQVMVAAPAPVMKRGQLMIAMHGSVAGLIIDRPEWRAKILNMVEHDPERILPEQRLLAALYRGGLPAAGAVLDDIEDAWAPALKGFIRLAATGDAAGLDAAHLDAAIEEAGLLLDAPLLRLEQLPHKRAVIDLVLAAHHAHPGANLLDAMLPKIQEALASISEWLAERSLSVVLERLLERYGGLYPKGKLKSWRARIAAIAALRELAAMPPREEQRARISLLGSITIQLPGEESVRVRGAQLCTLLGLMAADRMLAKPLTPGELMSIVMGSDRDPDSARKSMNFAVFRLREMLGSEAISTTGETPGLNLDLVEIDLLDAHRHLRQAAAALRHGALLRAYPELLAALEITAGKVPFPTLYGEFFESAREDFENELRSVVIRVAQALMREGDAAAAEQVLAHAFQAMPDDEDVAELLQQVLRDLGKRAEAVRIGLKVED